MAEPIHMISPDNVPEDVDPANVSMALGKGYRALTPEEYQAQQQETAAYHAGPGAAVLAGVADTIPFVGGALEKAGAAVAGKDFEALQREKQAHSMAHGLGEALGIGAQAVGMAATGGGEAALEGAGLLGEGGTQTMGLVGRTLTRAAIGSGEGALYGAGGAVNDAVLGNHPLTAEMLLAGAKGGALLGGILAGGFSVGGEMLSEAGTRIGNAARVKVLGSVVDQDLQTMADAGLGQPEINRAFREGLVKPGDTPVAVQGRLAERLSQTDQQIAQLGQKLDASGQTFDLRKWIGGASGGLEGEDAAPFGKIVQLRQALQNSGEKALVSELDGQIAAKAANVSEELGKSTEELLADQREFLKPLATMADDAVAKVHVPVTAGAAPDAMGSLLRNGAHFAVWNALTKMSGHLAAPFIGLSAANFLRKIITSPESVAGTFMRGLNGVARATGTGAEALETAVGAAVRGSRYGVGPVSGILHELELPQHATDQQIQQVRDRLTQITSQGVPNGNQHLTQTLSAQHAVLQAALPAPSHNPFVPASMARPQLGPDAKAIRKYNDTLSALANPMHVIVDLGQGKASPAKVAALKAGYPQIAQRAGAMMMNKAAESDKRISPTVKRAIEILQGRSLDPAFDPAKIARIQAIFAPAQPPGQGGASPSGQGVKLNQKGLANLDIGDRISQGMVSARDAAKRNR